MNDIETPKSLLFPEHLKLFWDLTLDDQVCYDGTQAAPMMSFDPTTVPEEADLSMCSLDNWIEEAQKIERKDETAVLLCGKKRNRRPKIFTVEDRM